MDEPLLEKLILEVQESAKYRHVSVDLIRRIGRRELTIRRGLKPAIKETKNTLHQVAGAYCDGSMRYADWRQALESADDPQQFRQTCVEIMERHASTRERAPFLEAFYARTLADIQPIRSVVDIACGLNPLAIPWMPLADDARYEAFDLYGDMMEFLDGFLSRAVPFGGAEVADVVTQPPTRPVHLALILKFLPVLEQTERGGSLRLLRALQAEHMLISFPTRSLGGRGKGMAVNYETRFMETIREETWGVRRFEFPNELCFLVSKGESAP